MSNQVLTINGGSSSVKFALFDHTEKSLRRELVGTIQRIGLPNSLMQVRIGSDKVLETIQLNIASPQEAVARLIAGLQEHVGLANIMAIGHRIVHGGPKYLEHVLITPEVLDELRKISPIDPDHLPGEIALIEAMEKHFPATPQVACFDTVFHRAMPQVAKLLPIPREYGAQGVRRYGFHGLSYAYLLQELARQAGQQAANGRVIFAHLGNGCSMAAVRGGKCVDTTMGFTPTAGLIMGTRTGDLDPGVLVYLMRQEKMDADQIDELVNKKSGLLGVSSVSSDMRDLLAKQNENPNAAEAVELFCYVARKSIGALAAALSGLDTLVFSGGIGENATEIRSRICDGLEHLGVQIDAVRNNERAPIISIEDEPVKVRVISTDEEITIARIVLRIVGQ